MTKSMILECLGFYLARVLILQADNDSLKSLQSAALILVDLEDHHQSLGIDLGIQQDKP
jgi:hypothetical protein